MIITNIYGGLGNQLFQYAFGKSLSIKQNKALKIDISSFSEYKLRSFLLNKFNIQYDIANSEELKHFNLSNKYKRYIVLKAQRLLNYKSKYMFEKNEFHYSKDIFESNAIYYFGYWQSYRYFEDIRDILLKEFVLTEPIDKQNNDTLIEINNSNSISLHVRRGDYIQISKRKNGNALCPISYYENAIELMKTKIENPHFFIFSDDIEWVKSHFKLNFKCDFIDFNSDCPEKDLNLIKNCKHNIIANSTFSWWGAWLNDNDDKIVIAPHKWMNNKEASNDLIPNNWIKI